MCRSTDFLLEINFLLYGSGRSWSSYRLEISVHGIRLDSSPSLGKEDCTMGSRFLWDFMSFEILSVLVIQCPGNFSAQVLRCKRCFSFQDTYFRMILVIIFSLLICPYFNILWLTLEIVLIVLLPLQAGSIMNFNRKIKQKLKCILFFIWLEHFLVSCSPLAHFTNEPSGVSSLLYSACSHQIFPRAGALTEFEILTIYFAIQIQGLEV